MEQQNSGLAEVIPITGRESAEWINGRRVYLGRLCQDELELLLAQCEDRMENARLELAIVKDHVECRPGGDAA
jgi:hypothetical protein